jgi:hypothetical protein
MAVSLVLQRIAGWESAGLIDHDTAERLRSAEASSMDHPLAPATGGIASAGLGVAEVFAYLGGLFVLLAWHATVITQAGDTDIARSTGSLIPGIALGVLGFVLAHRPVPMTRAAGIAWLISSLELGVAAFFAMEARHPANWYGSEPIDALVGAAVGLGAACVYRLALPAMATQIGVIVGMIATAWCTMTWADETLFGSRADGTATASDAELLRVALTAAWWWLVAAVLGTLAYAEARSRAPGSTRRADLARFAAAMTAVLGTTMAVMITRPWTEYGGGERVLEPAVGVALLLAVSAVLAGLALLRGSSAYLWPAALGVLIGFSDLNATYVVDEAGLGPALFLEALILFGVAGLTAAARRRIRGHPVERPTTTT